LKAQETGALKILETIAPQNFVLDLPRAKPKRAFVHVLIVKELTGEELFQYLHKITEPKRIDPTSEYTSAKSYLYSVAENITYNGKRGLLPVYSRIFIRGTSGNGNDYREPGDANGDGYSNDFINAEHLWPQSFFNRQYPMRADMHHLYPSLSIPNNKRANFSFAEVHYAEYSTTCGSKMTYGKFEPCAPSKGNVARGLFYFMVRYYDRNIRNMRDYNDFWISKVPLLLKWNREDPPDKYEMKRNNAIEDYQGNRNPFTDDPTLADRIGAAVFQSH